MISPRHRRRSVRRARDVKDRLIQTRVPERLESVLKEEAQKRRLTVSHLIRNMLEDTFELVDTVVAGAGGIVGDSVVLVEEIAHDAGKIAATVRDAAHDAGKLATTVRNAVRPRGVPVPASASASTAAPGDVAPRDESAPPSGVEHVIAWNQVVVNQAVECVNCGAAVPKGGVAHLGVSQTPSLTPTWLCPVCLALL
jgi:hypothetical protein